MTSTFHTPAAAGTTLTRADRQLFQGTAAQVLPWMSTQDILRSIGCDFRVIRHPAKAGGRTYGDCQLWLRDDSRDLLGFFGTRRQVIQPSVFIDYFRAFTEASGKQISLDVVGCLDGGRELYMAAKLHGNNARLLDEAHGDGSYSSGGGLAISNPRSSRYIPTEERCDHWLILRESFGESLRPRVMTIANELICSNSLSRRIVDCDLRLSHTAAGLSYDNVSAVLHQALRQCRAYERIKERLIETPISMETARAALRRFFQDADGQSRVVRRLEQIYANDLIGTEQDTRRDNAWRLASAVTQYTSHERIGRPDVAFRSQLDGSRARTANNFMAYLERTLLP